MLLRVVVYFVSLHFQDVCFFLYENYIKLFFIGIRIPSSNFSINDVRVSVGSRRVLDVMDVSTQKNSEMTMKEWQKYYEDPNKTRLLNVISLEFSHTKLENYIQSPQVVR